MRPNQVIRQRIKHPLLIQRRGRNRSPAAPAPAPEELPQIPESVVLDLQRLDESVDALDRIFLSILSAIERQARDAISVNENLSEVFAQGVSTANGTPVLDWSAERAVAPHDAYRQLAERLMNLTSLFERPLITYRLPNGGFGLMNPHALVRTTVTPGVPELPNDALPTTAG